MSGMLEEWQPASLHGSHYVLFLSLHVLEFLYNTEHLGLCV